jgi:light-regulated signal transduction histidine kinase (bacteriophytochrome)
LAYSIVGKTPATAAVDANKLVQEVLIDLDALINESGAKICCGKLPVIYGHHAELKSLFMNLLNNGLKFRKKNVAPVLEIKCEDKPGEWLFTFKDNGIGIEPEYQERIFLIFQKLHNNREYKGTGIGLAHCRKVAEVHHGKLWLESAPGQGSTFFFSLPKISKVEN